MAPDETPSPWLPPGASTTPNAERYLLEADALRRRQLLSALLHGSTRTWREQRRIWPGVVAGIVVVAVIVAVFGVLRAVDDLGTDNGSAPSYVGHAPCQCLAGAVPVRVPAAFGRASETP